ncbi:hypothetical protein M0R45_038228 [Rubus argutus]|uniref:Uncharacterized protein n=1 Tax=Rubus argutus TaxID=59490 RepID=A0AAW1W4N7_RUBAR
MCVLDSFDHSVLVWELKEEEEDLIIATGKLFSNELDLIIDCAEQVELISFDPQDKSVLYVKLDGVYGVDGALFLKINVRTGHLVEQIDLLPSIITNYCFFPLMEALTIDAWWPTPLPSS